MFTRRLIRKSVNLIPWWLRDKIRTIPLIAGLQRWLVRSVIGHDEFVHDINAGPARGLRVMIKLPADKGLWTGTYEKQFVEKMRASIKLGDVCLDIGGFHGFVSGVMGLAGASRVFCFEPLPKNAEVIQRLISLNPTLCIELRNEAVGAMDGEIEFLVMADDSMGKTATSPFQTAAADLSRVLVKGRSLDSLLKMREIGVANIIKIDVEGGEVEVLRGAKELLTKHAPELFIEAHSRELQLGCEELLASYGYTNRIIAVAGTTNSQSNGVVQLHAWKSSAGCLGR